MAQFHALFVTASFVLFLALIACGISFFSPFWLGNVTSPRPGSTDRSNIELNLTYIVAPSPGDFDWRGLWAQCSGTCQWFWANNYSLQYQKFTPLRWHLATQVLYFVGAFLVLFCEIYARVILCCEPRLSIFRSIGFILLTAFVIQAAAIAVFGGFANRDYGATAFVDATYTYMAWGFWMAVAGGSLTLTSGVLYLLLDCVYEYEDDLLK